jgi:multiple sugar transport system ATP-binding protein
VVLRGGRIEQVGTPLALYDRPANMFVAGFLGSPSMNFLPGRIEGGALVLAGGQRLRLAGSPAAQGDIVVGIRPQDATLDPGGTPARVTVVEPTGADTHVLLDVGGHEFVCLVNGRTDVGPGQEVGLSIASPQAHFFDPATELRVEGERQRRADVA